MPLELGAFLGAKHFGSREQKEKSCLILDSEKYRYQKFISDIAGQDVQAHANDPRELVRIVRNWLRSYSMVSIPSGSIIWNRYRNFTEELPLLCKALNLNMKELIFNDYVLLVSNWLKVKA